MKTDRKNKMSKKIDGNYGRKTEKYGNGRKTERAVKENIVKSDFLRRETTIERNREHRKTKKVTKTVVLKIDRVKIKSLKQTSDHNSTVCRREKFLLELRWTNPNFRIFQFILQINPVLEISCEKNSILTLQFFLGWSLILT